MRISDYFKQGNLWVLLFAFCTFHSLSAQVVINEVSASNTGEWTDSDGDAEDWLELFNNGNAPINLYGHFLSDDPENPYKWLIAGEEVLAPGAYLRIWASAKEGIADNGDLHTNFKIDLSGEPVLLTNPEGVMLDYFPAVSMAGGHAFGRQPDGSSNYRYFNDPTPGATNDDSESFQQHLSPPILFTPPGQYDDAFDLMVMQNDAGATLHYTLDGSHPTTESPEYTEPIELYDRQNEPDDISAIPTTPSSVPEWYRWFEPMETVYKGTTVRMRAFKDNAVASPIVSGFYIVDEDIEDRYDLPVLSITLPENSLFGGWGIYSQFEEIGPSWERLAHLAFYEPDGTLGFSSNVGLRLHGGNSRRYALKSFRVYFRENYGMETLNYDLFPGSGIMNHERLIVRQSGSEWNRTYLRDAFAQQLLDGYIDVDYMHYRPTVIFVNSEYWGVMNIRERLDDNYIRNRYGYNRHEIDLLEEKYDPVYGSNAHYLELYEFWENSDLSDPEDYAYMKTQVDVINFRDYHILQIFSMNTDQPGKNVRFWRPKNEGKWRWLLMDLDDSFAFGTHCNYDRNGLVFCSGLNTISAPNVNPKSDWPDWAPNSPARTLPLRSFLSNGDFRNDFIVRFADLLNTAFLPERLNSLLDNTDDAIAEYMQEHYERWHRPEPDFRQDHLDLVRNFIDHRKGVMEADIVEFFELSGSYDLTVDVQPENAGFVKVNSVVIHPDSVFLENSESYPWTGKYYADVAFPIAARPEPGYVFSHWLETGQTNDTIWIDADSDVNFTAVFESIPVAEPIHYWSFNNSNDPTAPFYTIGGGSLEITLGNYSISSVTGFSGENSRLGEPTATQLNIAQSSGSELVVEVPTTGFQSPKLSYEVRRQNEGAGLHRISMAANGNDFQVVDSVVIYNDDPVVVQWDGSLLLGAANNPNLKIKISMLEGEGGITGNNYIDNLSLDAIPMMDSNLPPGMEAPLFRYNLIAGTPPTIIDFATLVSDPDSDPVSFAILCTEGEAAQIDLSGEQLTIDPLQTGSFHAQLSMSDGVHQPVIFDLEVLVHPAPAVIAGQQGFSFTHWSDAHPAESFPDHMLFLQANTNDPGLETPLLFAYHIPEEDYHFDDITTVGFPYNNTARTRINGLNSAGISFQNTGRNRELGGGMVAIQTSGVFESIYLSFIAGTRVPHSKKYNLRLQYRLGVDASFEDVIIDGEPVEYAWNAVGNHMVNFDSLELPENLQNQPYVQLMWRYYYTGEQALGTSGKRAELRLDDIFIGTEDLVTTAEDSVSDQISVYPNPSSEYFYVESKHTQRLKTTLYSISGQAVLPVNYVAGTSIVNVSSLVAGLYILQVQNEEGVVVGRKKVMVSR